MTFGKREQILSHVDAILKESSTISFSSLSLTDFSVHRKVYKVADISRHKKFIFERFVVTKLKKIRQDCSQDEINVFEKSCFQ